MAENKPGKPQLPANDLRRVLPIARVGLQVVDTFTDSARGTGGFGHTGVR